MKSCKKIIVALSIIAFVGCKKEKSIEKPVSHAKKEMLMVHFKKEYETGPRRFIIDANSKNDSTKVHVYKQSLINPYNEKQEILVNKPFKFKGRILRSFMLDLDNNQEPEFYFSTIDRKGGKKIIGFSVDNNTAMIKKIKIKPFDPPLHKTDTLTEQYGELEHIFTQDNKIVKYIYHLTRTSKKYMLKAQLINPNSSERKTLQAIRSFLVNDFFKNDLKSMSVLDRKFQYALIDLNNDNHKEIIVRPVSTYTCGSGGCNLIILNAQFKKIMEIGVNRPPVVVKKRTVNGWSVLMLYGNHHFRELKYENGAYPTNPSTAPVVSHTIEKTDSIIFHTEQGKEKIYSF